jgi:hypothetical protein
LLRTEPLESRTLLAAASLLGNLQQLAMLDPSQFGSSTTAAPAVTPNVTQKLTSIDLYTVGTNVLVKSSAALKVTSTTTSLYAVALDQSGHPLATQPAFQWTLSKYPSGAAPSLATSGNTATFTFSKAGSYTDSVSASASQSARVTASASITVVAQPTYIVVNQVGGSAVVYGTSAQFTVSPLQDQFHNPMSLSSTLSWTANSVPAGAAAPKFSNNSSTTTVTFSAAGTYVLCATRTDQSKDVVSQSVTVTVAQVPTGTSTASPITCCSTSQQLPTPSFVDQFGKPITSIAGVVWTATTVPSSASAPTLTTNSSTTTATVTSAGTYGFRAQPSGGSSAWFGVSVNVVPTLSSIMLAPAGAGIQIGRTQQFSAQGLDQFGIPVVTQPSFTWIASSGTVAPSGLYTAPDQAGNYTVTAESGSITKAVVVTVTPGTPVVSVADLGGTYTGQPFPATASVAGVVNGVDTTPASSLEGVTPSLAYYAGATAGGTAMSSVPTAAGTYTVVAFFAGSSDYTAAQSAPQTFIIGQAKPTLSVADSGGTYAGQGFPATASVAGVVNGVDTTPASSLEGVTPSLAYYAGATAGGTPMSGVPGAAGTYTVVAFFAGSSDYTAAQSAPLTLVIGQAKPTLSVADSGGTYNGQPFPATASMAGVVNGVDTTPASSLEGVTPSLAYYAGATAGGTAMSGVPTAAGTYTVVAFFAGSSDYTAVQSAPLTFIIGQAKPTLSVADSGGTCNGQAFPATASMAGVVNGVDTTPASSLEGVTPSLAYYAGGTAGGTAMSGVPTATGTYTVVAFFAGSSDYTAVQSAPLTFTIKPALDTLMQLVQSLDADGSLGRNDMMQILTAAGAGGTVSAAYFSDLQTIIANAAQYNMPDYVRVLASDVVNGNAANATFQGASLGNLAAGSSATQLNQLISKWFYGADHPTLTSSTYVYTTAAGSLFPKTPSHNDEFQGELGDCYFISALGMIADQNPQAIENMFVDNGDGTFTVRFYTGAYGCYTNTDGSVSDGFQNNSGTADYVTVDRSLVTYAGSNGVMAYADYGLSASSSTNSLWIPLAEKAYAEWNQTGHEGRDGSNAYASIQGGWMATVDAQVLGYNASDYSVADSTKQAMVSALASHKSVTIATDGQDADGLYGDHAYGVIGYNSSTDTFTLYNPWGCDQPGPLSWAQLEATCYGFVVADPSGSVPIPGANVHGPVVTARGCLPAAASQGLAWLSPSPQAAAIATCFTTSSGTSTTVAGPNSASDAEANHLARLFCDTQTQRASATGTLHNPSAAAVDALFATKDLGDFCPV